MTSVSPRSTEAVPTRLLGSELLLRKMPVYARAKHFLTTNVEDPKSESNSLSYGPDVYPLLAGIRACYEAPGQPGPSLEADLFHGIDRVPYAHVLPQRRWAASAAAARDAAPSALLDPALGLPTLAQVLQPWFGTVDEQVAAMRTVALERAGANGKAGNEDDGAEPPQQSDAYRHRERLKGRADKRSRSGTQLDFVDRIQLYNAATLSEQEVLKAARRRTVTAEVGEQEDLDTDGNSTAGPVAPPADSWGHRMMPLITKFILSPNGASNIVASQPQRTSEDDQQQKVLAYMKRIRWIESQWRSARLHSSARNPTEDQHWSQWSEAQRVRVEMEHTENQRNRYRRTRRSPTDAKTGEGEEAAADAEA